jgi:membrane protein DedA with SNARE-associated domain
MMVAIGAIISVSGGLGYALPAIIGLESFGVPSPGETALILSSVLASEGKLQIWLVLVIGISSAIVGDSIGYELGRRLGREIITAPGPLHNERVKAIDAGERFFRKHGNKTVFFARWITGVRSAAAWLAGIDRMHYPTFLLFNAAGAITWGLTFGLVGYYGGQAAADVITKAGTYALVAVAVLAVVAFAIWRVRKRRRAAEPQASDEPSAEPPEDDPARLQ